MDIRPSDLQSLWQGSSKGRAIVLALPTLVIVVASTGSIVLATLFMVALGRASARGDEYVEPRRRSTSSTAVPPLRAAPLPRPVSYAGTAGFKAPELCLE